MNMNKQWNTSANTRQECHIMSASVVDRAAKAKPEPLKNLNKSDFTKKNLNAPVIHSRHDHHDRWAVKEHQYI